ncbi:MAG TPA: ParA family protein [Bacillota bacterium]|nr:ParA family protein [Bacillota bacterium]
MIIAVTNQKGGIGKTTTCLNLAACAALEGKKTCLIDLDPQANLTKTLVQLPEGQPTIYDVLNYFSKLPEVILETSMQNLYLVSSRSNLAGLERAGAEDPSLPYWLSRELKPHADKFDLIFIDTPPTLGALTINALTAATHLLVPVQPSFLPLQGTNDLLETYRLVQARFNLDLELLGVLITMYDPRTTLAKEAIAEIQNAFEEKVFRTKIRRSIKIEESPASGQSVLTYAPKSQGAEDYLRAYWELMKRA